MKALFPAGIAVLAMVGCTQQPSPPSPQGTLTGQYTGAGSGPSVVGGSAQNTTSAFDGTYTGLSNRSVSAAGTGLKSSEPSTTGCQQFDAPPTLTITNAAVPGTRGHICRIRDATRSFEDDQRLRTGGR